MKDIEGYEGLYAITEDGRVWSYPKHLFNGMGHSGHWLKARVHSQGYRSVTLCKDAICTAHLIHRLVAKAFLPVPELIVNHKNSDRTDNRLENLEWLTSKENTWHAMPKILVSRARGERSRSAKLTDDKVREIRSLYKTSKTTHSKLAELFGVDDSVISRVINRQRWTHVQ